MIFDAEHFDRMKILFHNIHVYVLYDSDDNFCLLNMSKMHHLTLQFQIRTNIMDKSKFAFQICAFTSGAKQSYVETQSFYIQSGIFIKAHFNYFCLMCNAMSNLDNNTQISKKYVLCNDNNIKDPFCSLCSISTTK